MRNVLFAFVLLPYLAIAQNTPSSQPSSQQASPTSLAVEAPLGTLLENPDQPKGYDPAIFQKAYRRSLYTMLGLFGASAASYGAVVLFGRTVEDNVALTMYGMGQGFGLAATIAPQVAYVKKGEENWGSRLLLRRLLIPSALAWSSGFVASRTYDALQPPCTPQGFDFSCVDFRGFSIFMGTLTVVGNVGRFALSSKHMWDLNKDLKAPTEKDVFTWKPAPLTTSAQRAALE